MNPANPITTLHVRRFIPAPRARVFAAFTSAEDLMKWFGPGPCHCLHAATDPRVGGSFTVRMRMFDGSAGDLKGEYREMRAPERLVFTWNWEGTSNCLPGCSLVTVDFVEIDNGTDVQLTHERLLNAVERDNHAVGWTGSFDRLAKFFAPGAAEAEAPAVSSRFCWNELLTSDMDAAGRFYTALFGWTTAPFPGPVPYTMFRQGTESLGGMMPQQQPGTPPTWLPYIGVADCDASIVQAQKLGATLCMPAKDIPTVGRIAIFTDPLGAPFGIHQPASGLMN